MTAFANPVLAEVYAHEDPRPEDEAPKGRRATSVYFLHAPDIRRLKIGYSTNVGQRVYGARAGLPREIRTELVGTLDGGRATERVMHERFAAYRISGEWFDDAILPDIRALIADEREWFGEVA